MLLMVVRDAEKYYGTMIVVDTKCRKFKYITAYAIMSVMLNSRRLEMTTGLMF